MKIRNITKIMALPVVVGLMTAAASAQIYSGNTVGYVNTLFDPGYNWFGVPLDYGSGDDTLDNEFTSLSAPFMSVGTTISLWNTTADSFGTSSTWNGTTWSANLTLTPGTGARLYTTASFTNTFTGTVLNFDGTDWNGLPSGFTQPPVFSGANGIYLLSSVAPLNLADTPQDVFNPTGNPAQVGVFSSILGRGPQNGESFTSFNPVTQTETTTTYISGAWNNGAPTLAVGDAAMFNIGPVPEPSTLCLGAAAGLLGLAWRRWRA